MTPRSASTRGVPDAAASAGTGSSPRPVPAGAPAVAVVAIDPGLANTGLVAMTHDRTIVATETIRTAGAGRRVDFVAALVRAETIALSVAAFIESARPEAIAIELYRDIPGRLRQAANRWSTPLVIGHINGRVLAELETPVVWQDPEHVMSAYKPRIAAAMAFSPKLRDQLSNEHLRAAACHAHAYLDRR